MSTAPAPAPHSARPTEIKIYSHSHLFYWWPVWLLGVILGTLTMLSKEYLVIVPADAQVSRKFTIIPDPAGAPLKTEVREGILLKPSEDLKKRLPPNMDKADLEKEPELRLHGTSRR